MLGEGAHPTCRTSGSHHKATISDATNRGAWTLSAWVRLTGQSPMDSVDSPDLLRSVEDLGGRTAS